MAGREECFPRGGLPFTKEMRFSGASDDALPFSSRNGRPQTPKSRKRKRSLSPLPAIAARSNELLSTTADALTYKTLQENMLVLGCIRNITPLSLEVELPGKIFGKVEITLISNRYTKQLEEEVGKDEVYEHKTMDKLVTMFHKGQFVPTKVLQKSETNKGTKIELSIKPEEINSDLNSGIFQRGLLVWAAVHDKLDHGYWLDAGVQQIKIFLPFANVQEDRELIVGQPLWCTVRSCEVPSGNTVVIASILEKDLAEAQMLGKTLGLHHFTPGMKFKFTVSKSVKYGIQGEFMKGCKGYINQAYLVKPMDNISKYKPGQNFTAWLLYVQPTTKLAYFTLRPTLKYSAPAQLFTIGSKLQSTVHGNAAGGLTIKLPENQKGFVSYNRLVRMSPNNADPEAHIHRNFPQGSSHQCQVLDYSNMEQLYICTFEKSKETIFKAEDVNLGELVKVKVVEINRKGLVVRLGKINAFLQNMHLSNGIYSENIKKKFSVGQVLQARVWSIDDKGVHLTHKQELINSDVCLCRYGDADVGKQYLGVVVDIARNGILVVYFGGVRGMLHQKYLEEKFPNYTENMFYKGQVIKTTVRKVGLDKLYINLDTPENSKTKRICTGQFVDAVVRKIFSEGLVVDVGPTPVQGFVPVLHLSSSLNLTSLLLCSYKPGDIIKDLLCIENRHKPILSKREATAYRRQNLKLLKVSDLKVGSIIRTSYESTDESGITVSAMFKPNALKLKILKQELDGNQLNLEPQQTVVAKVTKLSDNTPTLTARMSKVFNHNYEYSLDLLEQNLQDVETVRDLRLRKGLPPKPIMKVRLGQRVHGRVSEMYADGCRIGLENGVNGWAAAVHCSKKLQIGQKVTGVVLWVDYKDYHLELSLLESVIAKVNEVQDGVIDKSLGSTVYADLLVVTAECVVAVSRNTDAKRQLIFLPTVYHENYFNQNNVISYVGDSKKMKVVICRKVGNMLIGMKKSLIRQLEKVAQSAGNTVFNNRARIVAAENRIEDSPDAGSDDEDEQPVAVSNDSHIEECDEESPQYMSENEEMASEDNSEESEGEEDETELDQSLEDPEIKEECVDDDEEEEDEDELPTSDDDDSEVELLAEREPDYSNSDPVTPNGTKLVALVPGVHNFFSHESNKTVHFNDSSSEDDGDEEPMKEVKKEKKVTPAERKEMERLKEEELQRIERENADSTLEPQTVEQFQKLLKGKPNCSKSWTMYIAHLVSNAELEKAKDVAREALKTIDATLIQERYNIWLVYLNLENSYGDKSTLNEVFEEAVRCNDDLSIYLDLIKILANSQKFPDMEEKIQKAKRKFKQVPKMWIEIGRVYYEHNQFKEGRNLKDAALRTIQAKTKHIDLIVQFALMEFQFGEKNHGEALFETVLQHNPNRVDVWSTYVDQVVKKGDIEVARRILEKAVTQDLAARKLKTLFKKFKEFEIKNGDGQSVERVIELARQYTARK